MGGVHGPRVVRVSSTALLHGMPNCGMTASGCSVFLFIVLLLSANY